MVLNRIWIGMFLIAITMGFSKLIFWQDTVILKTMTDALFDSAKTAFELALYMTGTLCLWMGLMKIGEDGGAVRIMSRLVAPLFSRLFPEVPRDHPAIGSIMLNFSANMLGLDNAATPAGLKAMKELQTLNPNPSVATNAQIMFLVLNASGLTIIPVSILAARAANKSTEVASVFLPILLTTFFATLAGLIYVAIRQRISLFNKVILAYVGTLTALVVGFLYYLGTHPKQIDVISSVVSNVLLFGIILFFFVLALRAKVNLYNAFIEGAKDGFQTAINIVPYLVGMLAAVALFRACGALDDLLEAIRFTLLFLGIKAVEFVDALPVIFMKPFSGNGSRTLMVDTFTRFGADSFQGKLASTFQGSTETTFYVLAVYFGSVKVTDTRYTALAGILCDVVGGLAAIFIAYLFFT